jgi:hypothetical protein
MLGPEHFTLIVVVLMTVGILGVLIIGTMYRRQAGTPPRARGRAAT